MNLTPFCSPGSFNKKWREPWLEGGYRYATNAAIIIRVSHATDDVKKTEESKVMDDFPSVRTDWLPWPEVPLRVFGSQCFICMNNIDTDESICPICLGNQHVIDTDPACEVSGLLINAWYYTLIAALPNASYLPVDATSHWFRFDGGEGRIMGMKMTGDLQLTSPVDYAKELLGSPDGTRWKLSDGRCLQAPREL